MEETERILSVNREKRAKKIKTNNDIPKKNYFLYFLIFFNVYLLLRYIQLNYKNNNKDFNDDNNYTYFENNSKINDTLIKKKSYRLFLYKEDYIDKNNKKNQIHISMAIDNNFIYPALVSMTSALENNNKKINIIIYHLIFSSDFNDKNMEIFDSLKKKYDVKINYYVIPNLFGKYRTWMGGTNTIYYKTLLPLIFFDFERIIYLDADTLIFKDLLEMYNLPFNDNYILGYPFHDVNKIDDFVKDAKYYINGGVLLFNIKEIRKDNKDIDLIRFTLENNGKLWFLEQDSINVIFFGKVGLLPLKYGIYMYGNINSFEKSIQIRIRFKLNRTEIIKALEDPSIVHFSGCNPKVWYPSSRNEFDVDEICQRFHKEFYYYANKTYYYSDISNKYLK